MSEPRLSTTWVDTWDAARRQVFLEWAPVVLGLLVLYVPTIHSLIYADWATEEQAHGPIILMLSIWLAVRKWPQQPPQAGWFSSVSGWSLLLLGLALYTLGRSQEILTFELASLIVVLMAIVLIKMGFRALRQLVFPLLFLVFMLPVPAVVVSLVTTPIKIAVSTVVEQVLYWADYPIARSGVILQIGQYTLFVADACSGMQTLLTLEAIGLFYLNAVQHSSALRNVVLAILVIPISFAANVTRVLILSLITFHFGDEAGQGFLHGFAGIVLFTTALMLIIGFDSALRAVSSKRTPS